MENIVAALISAASPCFELCRCDDDALIAFIIPSSNVHKIRANFDNKR